MRHSGLFLVAVVSATLAGGCNGSSSTPQLSGLREPGLPSSVRSEANDAVGKSPADPWELALSTQRPDGLSASAMILPNKVVLGVPLTFVRPSVYTKGIDPAYDAPNIVADPSQSNMKGRLFVFMGETGSVPKMYKYIVAEASLHGFNAIALEYPNNKAIRGICATSHNPNCWGNARNEVLTGQNSSHLLHVNRINSIERRLGDLLKFLAQSDSQGGWSRFLTDTEPAWNLIEVGGHSQGGGFAAYISKFHQLAGDCSIEAPIDGNVHVPAAAWLSLDGQTSPQLGYGFANELDSYVDFGTMILDWTVLGFAGPQINVEDVTPPYFHSHQVFTAAHFRRSIRSHEYPVMDYITPIDANGAPVFAPVWKYACQFGS